MILKLYGFNNSEKYILSELKFNKTNIESMLINSSSFSTDLADLVMMKFKYDYKQVTLN